MLKKLKSLLATSRPVSWPNTAYPFAAGYLVSGGEFGMVFIVGTLYFLIPYNLMMYGVNDVFDYESDIRNPRKGGIEGAKEQRSFHPVILRAAAITNLPFLVWLFSIGDTTAAIVLLTLVFFVIAYSVAKLRFKEIPVLDSITSSIHFVGPMIYAFSLTGFSINQVPFIVAFFLWGLSSHALGAVQDIIPDRAAGLSSIATALGARTTTRLSFTFYLISSGLMMTQGLVAALVGVVGLLYALNILPYLSVTDMSSARVNTAWRRFIWLNLLAGFVITLALIYHVYYA